ncbi:MAG: hypothetical protein B1H07_02185 [Campylobacteraceae bacterium 4484_166]|nr:MAG: hypothetical protein B1H07_02185 [Campylobacteraceae bacterium 4484_166]
MQQNKCNIQNITNDTINGVESSSPYLKTLTNKSKHLFKIVGLTSAIFMASVTNLSALDSKVVHNFSVFNLTNTTKDFYIDNIEINLKPNSATTKSCEAGDIVEIVYNQKFTNYSCGDIWRIK